MKKVILSLAVVAFMGVSFTSCKEQAKEESKTEEIAKAEYRCPMKCEGEKTYHDKDTKCPECGMALKEVSSDEDHSEHGHD